MSVEYAPKLNDESERIADLLGGPDASASQLGLWPVLFASQEREGPLMEPQAGVPDLQGFGVEHADQAKETPDTGETGRTGGAR